MQDGEIVDVEQYTDIIDLFLYWLRGTVKGINLIRPIR